MSPIDQRLIDDQAIERFDQDYIDDETLDRLVETIVESQPGIADIADFGGGNGRLLDRLLLRMPDALGTNYEISTRLRALNSASPRKTVVGKSFLSVDAQSKYDLVLMNWVLHHMVGRNLRATKQLIRAAAETAFRAVRPGGALVVSENLLQSFYPEEMASAILFSITRSTLLRRVVSRMRDGAAVAGVGVYYMSEPQLHSAFARCEHLATFDRGEHDYGWKLKLIGISRVCEKVLVFRRPRNHDERSPD